MESDRIKGIPINCKGFGTIPKLVMQDRTIDIAAKALYAYFNSFAGNGDSCFPSREKICEDLCISKDRFSKLLFQLTESGYITVIQAKNERGQFSHNIYQIESLVGKPCPENPDTDSPDTEKLDTNINNLLNINNTSNINNKKKERKRSASVSYDSIVNAYTANNELRIAIFEFIKMRKFLNKPMTSNALQLMLKKLDSLASDEATKIAIVNQSSMNSWLSVYPLKENYGYNSNQPVQQKYTIGEDGKKYDSWGNELL